MVPGPTEPTGQGVQSVSIVPQQATLGVGQKQQFTATVVGGSAVTDFGVTWSSTDATVASVDANGMVSAVKAGTANIIATSKANTNFRAVAPVVVNPDVPGSVSFSGLIDAAGNPVNISNVTGQINARLNVQQGTGAQRIDSVQVVLRCGTTDRVAYTQVFSAGTPAGQIEAPINTAAFNATTGAPTFPNATCQMFGRGYVGGVATTATPSTTLVLNNADFAQVRVTTNEPQASNAAGLLWNSGRTSVAVLPVVYSGQTVASSNVTLQGTDPTDGAFARSQSITGTVGTVVFDSVAATGTNTATGGLTLPDANVSVQFIGATGQALSIPSTVIYPKEGANVNTFFRLDNEAPADPTSVTLNASKNWIGSAFAFNSTTTPTVGGADEGVNSNTIRYYAIRTASFTALTGGTGTGAACDVTGWTQVTNGSQLENTLTTTSGYRLRATITDRLGNVRCEDVVGSVPFGVDRVAPTATFSGGTAANSTSATAASTFNFAATDTLSGFFAPDSVLRATIVRNFRTGLDSTCAVGDASAAGEGCAEVWIGQSVNVTGGTGQVGYYTITAAARDVAGNVQSPALTRTALFDNVAPDVAANAAQTADAVGGGSATFTAAATDNLDLKSSTGLIIYNLPTYTSDTLVFTGNTLGTYGAPLETSGTASFTGNNIYRSLVEAPAGVVAGSATRVAPADAIRVSDQAGNTDITAANAVTFSGTATTGIDNTQITGFTMTPSDATPDAGQTINMQVKVTTPGTVVNQPLSTVNLYTESAGKLTLVGSQTAASVTINADGTRTYIYTVSWTAPSTVSTATTLRAIGMESDGDAVIGDATTLTTNP